MTWEDDDTIAVVYLRTQKLKRISTKGNVETVTVVDCMTVSSFKDGLACKSSRGILYLFDKSLNLKNTVSEVSTLLTCTSQSLEICWISGLEERYLY